MGRFKSASDHLHLCELFELQVVEDEFHFVIIIIFFFYVSSYCDLWNYLFESIQSTTKKIPQICWKYEVEILCWLFENDVFALANIYRKGLLVWAAEYFVCDKPLLFFIRPYFYRFCYYFLLCSVVM